MLQPHTERERLTHFQILEFIFVNVFVLVFLFVSFESFTFAC